MNIYGILTAAGVLPAYLKAKKKLKSAKTELQNFHAHLYALEEADIDPAIYADQNAPLDGIMVSAVLRLGNLVGQFCSADGFVTITDVDKDLLITHIGVSFEINKQVVTSYIPIGIDNGFRISPGETYQVPLSGNTDLILLPSDDKRDQLREQICQVAGKKLITSVKSGTEVSGICKAHVALYYTTSANAGDPLRAVYDDVPCVIRYMGEAFSPNMANKFSPTAGVWEKEDVDKERQKQAELDKLNKQFSNGEITYVEYVEKWREITEKYA